MRICARWLGFVALLECSYLAYYYHWSAARGNDGGERVLPGRIPFQDMEDWLRKDSDPTTHPLTILQTHTGQDGVAPESGHEAPAALPESPTRGTSAGQSLKASRSPAPSPGTTRHAQPPRTSVDMPGTNVEPADSFRDSVDIGDMGGHKGGECAQFEGVDFPLDPDWGANVRNPAGASVYGTGWAQRHLREHQFPKVCSGKQFLEHGMFRSGIGSNIHISAAVFAYALNTGRVYVWPEDDIHNPWTLGKDKKSIVECPGGKQTRSYECYLKPITSCQSDGLGPRFTGVAKERGKEKIKGSDIVPNVFKPLLRCSGYPKDYWRKWWRAQAAAFLVRLSPGTRLELSAFRAAVLVSPSGAGPLRPGTIGTHVRHGDKYYEAPEYPYDDYLRTFEWLAGMRGTDVPQRCPSAAQYMEPFKAFLPALATKQLYVGTDDPKVQDQALKISSAWAVTYMNVTRVKKRMKLMDLRAQLGAKQAVMESLLNLHLLLESDALVCTWTSNWCRLVDELRMTVAMKANHPSLEINKHCPSFNWVYGHGQPTPDFR